MCIVSLASGAHSYAGLCLFVGYWYDERWLARYVLHGVCEAGAGGNVDARVCLKL